MTAKSREVQGNTQGNAPGNGDMLFSYAALCWCYDCPHSSSEEQRDYKLTAIYPFN